MSGDARHPSPFPSSAAEIDRASSLCLHPPPGKFAGLFGAGAHRLALRALARPLLSGEPAVIVDGGNRFDPYEVGRAERALGGSGQAALSRLLVSRAFTCHQMEALLSRRLAPALARSGARFAVILGLPETFTDADVPFTEACRVFRGCLAALRRIARGGARVVLVGSSPPAEAAFSLAALPAAPGGRPPGKRALRGDGDRSGFLRHLVRVADPCLLLRREGDEWRATLRVGAEGACGEGHSRKGLRKKAGNVPREGAG